MTAEILREIVANECAKLFGPPDRAAVRPVNEVCVGTWNIQLIYPLAWLCRSSDPADPWHGHPVLLEMAVRIKDAVMAELRKPGEWQQQRRTIWPLMSAYGLMREHLEPAWKTDLAWIIREFYLPELRERAPRQAWRSLRGASPRRARLSQPPVPSVGIVEEGRR